MTPLEQRRAEQAERMRAECAEQGLPEHVEDPVKLARLVTLLTPAGDAVPDEAA